MIAQKGTMTHIQIQLGKTDGFRYVGMQPVPELDDDDFFSKDGALYETSRVLKEGQSSEGYLEVGFCGSITSFDDREVKAVANEIANTLRTDGHEVSIDTTIRSIGYGRNLF